VQGRDLGARLATEGLAFPVGHCSTVALGGYLSSGGFGWNGGAWGPACFSVAAIEVVTADGESRWADDDHDADLLWAARGAGPGFFGVITRYRLRLQALPSAIAVSSFVFGLEHAALAARWAAAAAAELPPSVELMLCLVSRPARPSPGSGREWACVVVATTFAGSTEEGKSALAPLLRGLPARECLSTTLHRPASFLALFDGMDALFPARHRYLAEALWSDAEPDELVDVACRHIVRAPSAKSLVLCPILPPPGVAPALPDAAFSMTARSTLLCYAVWDDPEQDQANRAWHRNLVSALEPRIAGYYIGESDAALTPALAERAFSPASWRRLQTLGRRYDPEGLFCGFAAF
jgi:FAD/FMN-containing dehydrogenase